jgi:hypothetical protein
MSLTIDQPTPEFGPLPAETRGGMRSFMNSGWVWMSIACTLIGVTGWLRTRQDRQLGIERNAFQPCPFNLDDIPQQIAHWKNDPTQVQKLDDKTVQITGSTNHLVRTYIDELTGVRFSLLVLYGPAEPVLPHTPEVCYPATGYALDGSIEYQDVPFGEGKFAQFRSATYSRPGTLLTERARVYYSFRLDGRWSPDVAYGMKFHRSNPGLFKVQIQRQMKEGERPGKNEPIEKFLSYLIPDIERRIAQADQSDTKVPGQTPPTTLGSTHASSGSSPSAVADDRSRRAKPAA